MYVCMRTQDLWLMEYF